MKGDEQTSNVPAELSNDQKRAAKKKRQRLRKKKRKLEALSTITSHRAGAEDSTGLDCSPGSLRDVLVGEALREKGGSVHSSRFSHCSTASVSTCDSSCTTHDKKRGNKQRLRAPEAAESVPVRQRGGSDGSNDRRAQMGAGSNRETLGEGARLSEALKSVRKKQRDLGGKGRPIFGWDISALAELAFSQLAGLPEARGAGGLSAEIDEEAVAAAVGAVIARADEEYDGQVTIAQFEELVRSEVPQFWMSWRARSLLRRALLEEQAGNIEAAETECAASLAVWSVFASGHLKMAQILRARGVSEQRAIRDVEFHLKRALTSAAAAAASRHEGEEREDVAREASERLSLLLCQEGRYDEAAGLLKRRGFRYRLSSNVLRYPLPGMRPSGRQNQNASIGNPSEGDASINIKYCRKKKGKKGDSRGQLGGISGTETEREFQKVEAGVKEGDAAEFVSAVDSALPMAMLEHLQEAFGSQSRFWSEHGYNSETGTPGYFSYVHSLDSPPESSIEQVINRIKALAEKNFPAVKEARFVEWWAHRRPHSSGHQLHFDSDDEGRGGVRNPIVSAVVYVTGDIGGPTLVTTQRLDSKRLADRGWIVYPRVNRVCMFDGGVLHGVIPGRGVPPPPPSWTDVGDGDGGQGEDPLDRERSSARVTWMVAFWRDIQARPRTPTPSMSQSAEGAAQDVCPSGAGAAQPFPTVGDLDPGGTAAEDGSPTWPALFRKKPEGWGEMAELGEGGPRSSSESSVIPLGVSRVWEDVDCVENRRLGIGVGRLKRLPEYDLCFQGF